MGREVSGEVEGDEGEFSEEKNESVSKEENEALGKENEGLSEGETEKENEGVESEKNERDERKKKNEEERRKRVEERKRLDRLYAPPLPFPYRRVEKQLDEKFKKFLEHMQKMEMKIPFLDVMAQMPKYAKFLKDLLSNKKKLEEDVTHLPHQVSVIVQGKLPFKERDPGPYNLPVKLGNLEPKRALVDLGASISLMPLSITKRLPFKLKPSRKTIQLADRSIKLSCGEFEDLPIQV